MREETSTAVTLTPSRARRMRMEPRTAARIQRGRDPVALHEQAEERLFLNEAFFERCHRVIVRRKPVVELLDGRAMATTWLSRLVHTAAPPL